jgi:type III secretion protein S
MSDPAFFSETHNALVLVMLLSAPVLGVATVVGLVIGLLQAVTQIQDQTLPLAVKLMVVWVMLLFIGPLVAQPLLRQTERLLTDFPALTR